MTPEQKKLEEEQIKNVFSEIQQKIGNLKDELKTENDETKKQEKNEKIQRLENQLAKIKDYLDKISSLNAETLTSLKETLNNIKQAINDFRGEVADLQKEKTTTPKTCELLKGSETYNKLLNIISSNPNEFKNLPGDTADKKLEYIFNEIRDSIVQFMENKLGSSEKCKNVINNTIAPAFERNLMELLRNQGNEGNTKMLQQMDKISWSSLKTLLEGVGNFAKETSGSFNKFNAWINAIDYLSIHKGILDSPEKSEILTNPLKFQEYLNNSKFASNGFDPYSSFSSEENKVLFKIDENQNFEFGLSLQEKQEVLSKIGNIRIVDNPKTTALIAKMAGKPKELLKHTPELQKVANSMLNGVNAVNGITKMIGIDLIGEITKPPEDRSFRYRILNFVCKLIGFTGGLEGIVKTWRIDRLGLTNEKNDNIKLIYEKFRKNNISNKNITISDQASCDEALKEFDLTDLDDNNPSTRGDFLCLAIADNIKFDLVPPSIVKELMGNDYIKSEEIDVDGKKQIKESIDTSKFSEKEKKIFAYKHINTMKDYFKGNYNNLSDFFTNIQSADDITICMTTALYTNKNDVIEGVKAKVFLPENYGVTTESTPTGGGDNGGESQGSGNGGKENLDSNESSDKQTVSEQWIFNKAKEYGITDNRQIAYVLSTIKGESGFKNQKEIGGENRDYGKVDSTTGKAYYGRGFIQITHKGNYQAYTQIIKESGKDFKDNNGNTIKGSEIDLVQNPDIILQSNDLAAFIAMDWMKNGGPTRQNNRKLDYYINDNKQDYYNARIIINGMSSNPKGYADTAQEYLNKLGNGTTDKPQIT